MAIYCDICSVQVKDKDGMYMCLQHGVRSQAQVRHYLDTNCDTTEVQNGQLKPEGGDNLIRFVVNSQSRMAVQEYPRASPLAPAGTYCLPLIVASTSASVPILPSTYAQNSIDPLTGKELFVSPPVKRMLELFGEELFFGLSRSSPEEITKILLDEIKAFEKGILRPLSPEAVGQLVGVEVSEKAVSDEQLCALCFRQFKRGNISTALNCAHLFHHTCIKLWWSRAPNSCPSCFLNMPIVLKSSFSLM